MAYTKNQILSFFTVTREALTDASTITWAFDPKKVAFVDISASRTLSITGIPSGVSFGQLEVKHSTAGTVITLPGNSDAVGWNAEDDGITFLGFYYNGTSYLWFSHISPIAIADTTPPELVSATVNDDNRSRIVLQYNESLSGSSVPDLSEITANLSKTTIDVIITGVYVYVDVDEDFQPGDDIEITYAGGTDRIKDLAGNIADDFTDFAVTNNIPELVDITMPGVDLINTSGVITTGTTNNAYGHTGLSASSLAAAAIGFIQTQYKTDAGEAVFGFNSANTATGWAGMEAGLVLGASGLLASVEGAAINVVPVTLSNNQYVRIYRTGTVLTIGTSMDGASWTTVYTFTYSSAAQLYIVCDLYGASTAKLYYPKGSNVT